MFSRSTRLALAIAIVGTAMAACSTTGIKPASTSAPSASTTSTLSVASRYQPAPTMTVLVVPNFAAGREVELITLARSECGSRAFCSVGIWTDDSAAPRRIKMTANEVSTRAAQLTLNTRTGLYRMLWNCDIATNIAGECL